MNTSTTESEKSDDSLSVDPLPIETIENVIPITTEEKTKQFINNNYFNSTIENWNDWKWQIRNSIVKTEDLVKILGKKKDNIIINIPENHLPFRITPYFASLLDRLESNHPLYKTIIPTIYELNNNNGEKSDPLDETGHTPVKNIVHKYPDRVLFLVTGFCSTYCRYCTRTHMVSKNHDIKPCHDDWEEGFKYIEQHKEIRDVLISGGDPFTMSDDKIEYILNRIRSIKHVEIIRIGTKIPVVLPMRITNDLVNILKKYHPLYINIHFTHPDELSDETKKACNMLADAGIPLGSQTVLLKDINDDANIMKKLMHDLLMIRVKPYYMYQMDKVPGATNFETPIEKGLEIIDKLRGWTSGHAVPKYIVDSEFGKIDVSGSNIISIDNGVYTLKSYEGKIIFH